MTTIRNCLTIDVEDYFQVNAFAAHVHQNQWQSFPLRVDKNTHRILDILDGYSIKATFFVLGWVAERLPSLVREIHHRGHEIACHGYWHELIYAIGPEKFREDIRRSKTLLENQIGEQVNGYRAPSYSITNQSLWALNILVEEGFTYDSSIFPILHDTYGIPDAKRFPHTIETDAGPLAEFPLTTVSLNLGWKKIHLPIAGGGYLRLLPADVIRSGITRINTRDRQPAVLYFHPWEIDPDQPRIKAGMKSRFRHYLNLRGTESKLMDLFEKFDFAPMKDVFSQLGEACEKN
ncbi:MAG: polysaccharide deacetylase [Desulfobulbaceae bacterium BRH_c16a]|nr:MAG: polysaccharide deacetylase [Desulfobulbaceae bacterium BRH_c16a]